MKYKVKQIIEKSPPYGDRKYPIYKVFLEDEKGNPVGENGKHRVVKLFFDVEEGKEYDLNLEEQEFRGVKELKGTKVKEKKTGGFKVNFANTEEGQKLIARMSIFKTVVEALATAQSLTYEQVESFYKLGEKLVFGSSVKSEPKPKEETHTDFISKVNEYLRKDFTRYNDVINRYLVAVGKSSIRDLNDVEQEELLNVLSKEETNEG